MIMVRQCGHCGHEGPLVETPERSHIRGNCRNCGAWAAHIPKRVAPGEETLPFGKYKGRTLAVVPRNYLRWIIENASDKLTDKQRSNMIDYLEDYE